MKRFSTVLTIAMAALLVCQSTTAKTIGMGGVHFQVGFPQGEFKDNIDRNAYGINADIFYSPGKTPVGIGIVLGYGIYGEESRREPFSTTIPDVTVKVTTTNSLFLGHLCLRVVSKRGFLRPYGEGLAGFSALSTETSISDASDNSEVASSTNKSDGVFSYGAGGGIMMLLGKSTVDDGRRLHWMLDIGVRYILGGEAEYLKEGSIRRTGGKVEYDFSKSKTDLLNARIGVSVLF